MIRSIPQCNLLQILAPLYVGEGSSAFRSLAAEDRRTPITEHWPTGAMGQ
jgi:hypothetical protein